jgi:AcrR family transcriptional regulator
MAERTTGTSDGGGGELDPRVARTRAVVLAATRELLTADGVAGATIEAVSRRTGVARTTIYRHWDDVHALVSEAFDSMAVPWDPPDTGRVRDDLVAHLGQLRDGLTQQCWGRVLPTLVDAASRDAAMRAHQARIVAARRTRTIDILRRGMERGELPAGCDLEALCDHVAAPVFYRHLLSGAPLDDAVVERCVDAALAAAAAGVFGPVRSRAQRPRRR